jgi:hypothetical protein
VKPASEQPDGIPVGSQRRRVRFFVALHLGAVGTIYAVAVVVGGGFAGPPMPPLTVAMARPEVAPTTQHPSVAAPVAVPAIPAALPDWTSRSEIAAPWESR